MFPCFPLPGFTQRLRSGLIWKSRRPTRTSESWVDLTVLYSNFVCFSLFLMNLLRYCGIKVNGSKEQPSRFLKPELITVWLIRYNHCKIIKLTFFVPFTKNGPCVPTISWVYFIFGSKISTPQNAPRYLPG